MKFRIFLGIVCLAFVASLLAYGSQQLNQADAVAEPTPIPTPIVINDLPESLSCGDEILFDDRPLVAGFVGRPASLLPFSQSPRSQLENDLSGLIFRGLVRFTPEGQPVPDLATWQISEDGMSVTFSLDQGGIWHDGTPVSAADVAFTANLLAAGNFTTPGNFPWGTVTTTVLDTATVQMTLPIPFAPFLEAATIGILPAHVGLNAQNLVGSDFSGRPIGSGPFQVLNNWESDGLVFLSPVQGSFIPNLEVRFYPSTQALTADLQTKQVDLAIYPANSSIAELGSFELGQLNVYSTPADQSTQLFFRMDGAEGEPITDPAVRQALRLMLDRQSVIDESGNGQGVLIEGPWDLNSRFRDGLDLRLAKTDVDRATVLLNEAGWVIPEEGGTTFQKEEVELSLTLITQNRSNQADVAAAIAQQWQELGVGVTVDVLSPAEYQTAITNRTFDATVQKVNLSADPDLYDFWSQEAIVRGQNFSRWNNRSASEALEAGRQTWEDELRVQFYKAFSSFYERELPAITVYQDVRMFVMNGNVRGQTVGTPADLTELLSPFPQWVILADQTDECDQN